MKSIRQLLTNPWFVSSIGIYLVGIVILSQRPEFSVSDAILELLIFAVGFSLIAWWTTMRATPLVVARHPTGREMLGLVAYVGALSVYLAFGPQKIDSLLPHDWISSERIRFFVNLIRKLLVFVAIPFVLFGPLCGYRLRDFGWQRASLRELGGSHFPVVALTSLLILAFQYFLGGGAAPLREGKFTLPQLIVGLPLCCAWLAIEAGLVEEFFFRALLQSRLSGWFRSEITGVVLMSLLFGLAHAPGFIFRHAGVVEGLGANPSTVDALAYSIVTLAVSGIFFGIIWVRTRNLLALIIIHAATDLFPNFSDFVSTWGL